MPTDGIHGAGRDITRRQFVGIAVGTSAAAAGIGLMAARIAPAGERPAWPIGCFNRPWAAWSYDQALDGMQAAGYALTGLLGDHAGEPFTSADATDEYLEALGKRIEARKLSVNVAWLRTQHGGPLGEAIAIARQQIDHAQRLGAKYLLTTGVDRPDTFEHYCRVMAEAAAFAADRGMEVVLKPHGGCSATADEMLRTLDRVGRANFRIWYDAGNIVHYTDADPVADVARVADRVAGFSAKDCAGRGGDVMLQLGEGKVDFRGVFGQLQRAGFNGPVMVECCRGSSLSELTAGARANRLFLERLLAALGGPGQRERPANNGC